MKSAVTISLVPAARGGPFVFWDDLEAGAEQAAQLGFDAIEIFPPSSDAIEPDRLRRILGDNNLKLAAVGTGAGWVNHRLTLSTDDAAIRSKALDFVWSIIDFAASFGAPAIIGSMQGRSLPNLHKEAAKSHLGEALKNLADHATSLGVPLLMEPLNRYETDLVNTLDAGVELIQQYNLPNVRLLADLFHMNIEEVSIPDSIRRAGAHIGHVHFADSNRRAVGMGHTDFPPIFQALRDIGYSGYLSAEVFPLPSSLESARQTIESFRKFMARS